MTPGTSDNEEPSAGSYFIPMVDMLAGVVFLLVIMLASVTLVSRSDFKASTEAKQQMAKIEAELDKARRLEAAVLEPRRNAEAALRLMVQRIGDRLAAGGVAAKVDPELGRLSVPSGGFFAPDGKTLSSIGSARVRVVADAFAAELPCLAASASPRLPACPSYPPALLDRAVIGLEKGNSAASPVSRALLLLSAVAQTRPELLSLRAADGGQMLSYRGLPQNAARDPSVMAGDGDIVLGFQIDLPAIPEALDGKPF